MRALAPLLLLALSPPALYRLAEECAEPVRRGGPCSVLVLGTSGRGDGTPSAAQRFRVRAGARVLDEAGCGRMILAGGAAADGSIEAETMAAAAREAGVPEASLVLETRSRSTWENARNALPLLPSEGSVYVVSDSLHALRGARNLRRLAPGLAPRVRAAGKAPPLSQLPRLYPGALHELYSNLRDALFRDRTAAPSAELRGPRRAGDDPAARCSSFEVQPSGCGAAAIDARRGPVVE